MPDLKFQIAKGLKILLNPPALKSCQISPTARVCSRSELSRVTIGNYSYVGNQCFMVNTRIGSFCSIADRCTVGGAAHPVDRVSSSPVFHRGKNILKKNFAEFPALETPQTIIEDDVWLGMGCFVKAGITIHTGAVVGMGSIVTHDIPPYEIWAGNPAQKIRDRFDRKTIDGLLASKWWTWDDEIIGKYAQHFNDVNTFLNAVNLEEGY